MSEDAKNELHEQLNIYVKSVIREVCLIEEGSREEGANREITSSMIKLAVKKYSKYVIIRICPQLYFSDTLFS